MSKVLRTTYWVIALSTVGSLAGCANYEINTGRGNIPGHYIRYEMQEADRTVEAARLAGKDKQCPDEFKAAEDAKDKAYDTFRACFTEKGSAQAKAATAMAKALCPPQQAKPALVIPAPAPTAPQNKLTITPGSLTRGETATMTWSSNNADNCVIEPGFGPVPTQGTMTITPSDDTNYTLTCSGEGGAAKSSAAVAVNAPAPVAAPAPAPVVVPPPPAPAVNYCKPMVMDVQFDTNKYDVKPQYKDELKMLADFLKEFPEAKGIIEGHTDSVGDKASNMKLSQKRADSVRSYLIDNFGIAPDRIAAKGYGPTKPIADNKTKQGKAKNRRIEANFTCK